jgi:alkane 1-monooxygenase
MRRYRFAAISILPLASLAGLLAGGWWCWSGVGVYFALYLGWDELASHDTAPPSQGRDAVLDAVLLAQLPLVLLVWGGLLLAFSGRGGISAGLGGWLGEVARARQAEGTAGTLLGACLSFVATVSIAGTTTAHELVHRPGSRVSTIAGRMLLAFILDATFAIEHVYGHHVRVGMREDPATARRGESVYRFILRSTVGGVRSAWQIERRLLERRGIALWSWRNRNLRGAGLSLVYVLATAACNGWLAGLAFIGCGLLGKALLEMSNYVEHYGLVRVAGTRVEARHAWDTPAAMTAAGMFNLGRHAAHHIAVRPYWQLPLEAAAPQLPGGLVMSGLIALVPPLWFRIMGKRLRLWDRELATPDERALAAST